MIVDLINGVIFVLEMINLGQDIPHRGTASFVSPRALALRRVVTIAHSIDTLKKFTGEMSN